ncbi:hypothetical protein APSETT445_009118 [Aspergillus pseudonomiae]
MTHPFLAPHDAFLHSSPPGYLLDVVQFISLHYLPASNVPDHTHQLRTAVQEADASLEKVQALLLLSIIMHARTQPREAKECLGQAIALSLDLGLHCREFSDAMEVQNPVGAESARRTWWEIFIIDTLLAAVQVEGALQLTIETPDLPLPCEMDEYQDGRLGIVPTSLRDMDRQALFHNDGDFSSAAYRVEAATILRSSIVQLAIFTADPQQSTRTGRNFLALNIGVLKSMGPVWAIAAASMARIRDVAIEVESALAGERRGLLDDQLTQSALVDSQELDLTLL